MHLASLWQESIACEALAHANSPHIKHFVALLRQKQLPATWIKHRSSQ